LSDPKNETSEQPDYPGNGIVPVEDGDDNVCMKKRDFWTMLVW